MNVTGRSTVAGMSGARMCCSILLLRAVKARGARVADAACDDAQRNRKLLLAAVGDAFAAHGTDASLREVARRAGVGIGTLYRVPRRVRADVTVYEVIAL